MIKDPLKCEIQNNKIIISIGFDALKFLAEENNNCGKYDKISYPDGYWTKITNKKLFAKEILRSLTAEEEDGTTIVHTLFENAINIALENGAEGIKLK